MKPVNYEIKKLPKSWQGEKHIHIYTHTIYIVTDIGIDIWNCDYPHFTDKENVIQKDYIICQDPKANGT